MLEVVILVVMSMEVVEVMMVVVVEVMLGKLMRILELTGGDSVDDGGGDNDYGEELDNNCINHNNSINIDLDSNSTGNNGNNNKITTITNKCW